MAINFTIEKKLPNALGRAGRLTTAHGEIETPAFVTVGTKANVKALTPQQLKEIGVQVVLGNAYHLYLQPGDELVRDADGLGKFMGWDGPTMTDSGGFQAFSLGAGFGGGSKFRRREKSEPRQQYSSRFKGTKNRQARDEKAKLALVDDEGVTFRSHIDGSTHRFTPERSIEIQKNIGADIIFAFDECTAPDASEGYQMEAMKRTHVWAERSLNAHKKKIEGSAGSPQALFGIVQGGRFEKLRKESARSIGDMDFDGFGIGGSFSKEDLDEALIWVNEILPKEKPRHLLGIGEPADLFAGVEHGIDTFDCVAPTRIARTGMLYTKNGPINILNAKYRSDLSKIEEGCGCPSCKVYTKAYVAHLFRAEEMLAATLASLHNLWFIHTLMREIRIALQEGGFEELKKEFLSSYYTADS